MERSHAFTSILILFLFYMLSSINADKIEHEEVLKNTKSVTDETESQKIKAEIYSKAIDEETPIETEKVKKIKQNVANPTIEAEKKETNTEQILDFSYFKAEETVQIKQPTEISEKVEVLIDSYKNSTEINSESKLSDSVTKQEDDYLKREENSKESAYSSKSTISKKKKLIDEIKNDNQKLLKTKSSESISSNSKEVMTQESKLQLNDTVQEKERTLGEDNISNNKSLDSNADVILLLSLGGGEDEIFTSNAARLLHQNKYKVVMVIYGSQREMTLPKAIEVIEIPATRDDPLLTMPVHGSEEPGPKEWSPGSVVWSRVTACAGIDKVEKRIKGFKPSILITPLWLHDVCTLSLAQRMSVPAIGVITSRVGAWWVWAQLGALPALATASAPTGNRMSDASFLSRSSNLAQHFSFMSTMQQRWQVAAASSLPDHWDLHPLSDLYGSLRRVLVLWDPVLHPSPPHTPVAVSIGGFDNDVGAMSKDILVPALMNRAGVIVVKVGDREVWIGEDAKTLLHGVLSTLPYTILWATPHPHLKPRGAGGEEKQFVYKEELPLNAVLGHPRHRLLISPCGEHDVTSSSYYASPVLCLPVTTDQLMAAQHLQDLGVALSLPAWDVSADKLADTINKLTKDRRFRQKARELAEEIHDLPLSPADNFLYHVLQVIRKPHSKRYRITGSSLSLFQQSNTDVYLALVLLGISLVTLLIVLAIVFAPIVLKKMKHKKD